MLFPYLISFGEKMEFKFAMLTESPQVFLDDVKLHNTLPQAHVRNFWYISRASFLSLLLKDAYKESNESHLLIQ